jgi:hypothetical protein
MTITASKLSGPLAARAEPEVLYPRIVVSHPCDKRKSQGWGTEVWGTAIMELL